MKLSLKSFLSLLKYIMVIVIIFAVSMVAITLFMPTSMENFKEGVDGEITIDTLTRHKITHMDLNDLYKYAFEPFSDFTFKINDFLTKAEALADKLKELGENTTNPLTEEDINTLVTKKIIEVPPSDTHKKIGDFMEKMIKYSRDNQKEIVQHQTKIRNMTEKLNTIFKAQTTKYSQVIFPVIMLSDNKNKPPLKNGPNGTSMGLNPFTKKNIDQFTGLPVSDTPSAETTLNASSNNARSDSKATPAARNTVKYCNIYNNNEKECNKSSRIVNGVNCKYDSISNKCSQMQQSKTS